MKLKLFTIVLFVGIALFGQTYSFSKLTKKDISGSQERIEGSYSGPYQFVFENINSSRDKLFTLLAPGQNNAPGLPWFGILTDEGYIDFKGKSSINSIYYYTKTNEKVRVIQANDFSFIAIIWSNGKVWEYSKY